MLARNQLLRRYRQTGAMNGLLNLYGFLDDQVFLTKSGDVGVVLAVTGVDYEGLEPAQRDGVARRFESALRLLDDRFRLLQYLIKQRGPTIPAESHPDPVIDGALRDRQDFLEARRPDLYDLDLFFVVLYEGAGRRRSLVDRATEAVRHPRAALADWLSTARTLTLVDDDLERARQQLLTKVEAFVVQLEDTVRPTRAGQGRGLRLLPSSAQLPLGQGRAPAALRGHVPRCAGGRLGAGVPPRRPPAGRRLRPGADPQGPAEPDVRPPAARPLRSAGQLHRRQ